jgi:hypothetical protein
MGRARIQLPKDPAEALEYIRWLADHPQERRKLTGKTLAEDMADMPKDSRRPTDPQSKDRFMADYSSPKRDQDDNYGSGLL